MQLPPITASETRTELPAPVYSPRVRASYATFRLFHGEEPPTLSIKDQVAVTLAERIVEQRLLPGQRIPEQSIAEEFGVSKAPVSEALMLLEYNGLVESAARRSARVTPIGADEFEQLMEYRAALVGVVFPRFVERHVQADRTVLRDYLDHMKDLAPQDARAFEFAEVADRSILYMSMQCGNRHIARAMSPLSLRLLRYYALGVGDRDQRQQLVGWWGEALDGLEARQVTRFMEIAARSRAILVAAILRALGRHT